MFVKDILERQNPSFSFEFFPPKTDDGWQSLFDNISSVVRVILYSGNRT